MDTENRLVIAEEEGSRAGIGSVGLADANWHI